MFFGCDRSALVSDPCVFRTFPIATEPASHINYSGDVVSPRQLFISPFQSDLLDLSRWVAAFLVVVEHARSLMFPPSGADSQLGLLGKAFYFMTGFGHASVMVFFVMSGFL